MSFSAVALLAELSRSKAVCCTIRNEWERVNVTLVHSGATLVEVEWRAQRDELCAMLGTGGRHDLGAAVVVGNK